MKKGDQKKVGSGGYVQIIDWMGDDARIVDAARVSYGEGTRKIQSDRNLIRYLMRHWHTTPFEQCELQFKLRVPMDIWRQIIRHRTASVNEYSTRYSIAINEAARTQPNEWRLQDPGNRQGSTTEVVDMVEGSSLTRKEWDLHKTAREVYEDRLEQGVAREQARKDLPLSTYTEAYWKIDLHNLFHFLHLRLDSHTQKETREFAEAIANFTEKLFPIAYEAFEDYRVHSITLSRNELELLKMIILGVSYNTKIYTQSKVTLSKREQNEFADKLKLLGVKE